MSANMYLARFAFRNVFRHKRRSALTIVVIMFSVGTFLFFLSYLEGVTESMVEDSVKVTGHIIIHDPEYRLKERMLSLTVPVENYGEIRNRIAEIGGVRTATGRIKFGGLLDFRGHNEPGIGMGIDPAAERDILQLENSLVEGRYFRRADDETVIGIDYSRKLGIALGDTVTVISRTARSSLAAENLVVVGIADLLSTPLNRMFYMNLSTAQYMLDMEDQVVEIVVFLDDPSLSDSIREKIENIGGTLQRYTVLTWMEKGILKDILPMINTIISVMILLFGTIAAFSIINTMLMSVFERTKEIGVLSAFGMKRRTILKLFVLEALVLGIAGGLFGLATGGYAAHVLETHGLTIGEIVENFPMPIRQTIYGDLTWHNTALSFALGLGITLAGGFFPSLKAARLEPVDALRKP